MMETWWKNDGKWWKSLLSPSEIRVFITMTAMLTMILMGLYNPVDGFMNQRPITATWHGQRTLHTLHLQWWNPRVGWLSYPFLSHLHIHNLQRMLERTPNKSAPQNERFECKTTTCIQDIQPFTRVDHSRLQQVHRSYWSPQDRETSWVLGPTWRG